VIKILYWQNRSRFAPRGLFLFKKPLYTFRIPVYSLLTVYSKLY